MINKESNNEQLIITYLAPNVLGLVLVVIGLHAELQLLEERVLRVLVYTERVNRARTYWLFRGCAAPTRKESSLSSS